MPKTTMFVARSASVMAEEQNSELALEQLLAQRLLYSRAKRYFNVRVLGVFVIGTVAPIVGGIWPGLAAICGSVAGVWLFVGRTFLTRLQNEDVDRAAAVQEGFDSQVFGMTWSRNRERVPSLEDVEKLVGDPADVKRTAKSEKLRNWYTLDLEVDGADAVAICQRANVSYSDSLLRTTSRLWWSLMSIWIIAVVLVAFAIGAKLETFLLVAVLPLLPAFLDIVEFTRRYRMASHTRATTARQIQDAVESSVSISGEQVLVWQERIYELRRETPLVPDVIYWLQRKQNEQSMTRAARRLGKRPVRK